MIKRDDLSEDKAIKRLLHFIGRLEDECPYCKAKIKKRKLEKVSRCSSCGKKYSWRSSSIYKDSNMKAGDILLMFDRFDMGKSDMEIAKELGIYYMTVKVWHFKYNQIKGE